MLAKRGGQRAVIRYKLYKSAVGTKAVQEAYAAMIHYSADDAAVTTSSGFTPLARRLSAPRVWSSSCIRKSAFEGRPLR